MRYKPNQRTPLHPNGKPMYVGANPQYAEVNGVMTKVRKGVPFRKTDPITGEVPQ